MATSVNERTGLLERRAHPSTADERQRESAIRSHLLVGLRRTPALTLIAVLLVAFALSWGRAVLIPIVLAVMASFALDPLHRRVVGLGLSRGLAAALLIGLMLSVSAVAAVGLRSQATVFINEMPQAAQRLRTALRDSRGAAGSAVAQVQQAAGELKRAADESAQPPDRGVTRVQVEDPALRLSDLMWRGSLGAIEILGQVMVVLFLLHYLLAGGDRYKRKIVTVAGPSGARRRLTVEVLQQVHEQIARFLMARVVISLMVGGATGVAFWALGVPQAAMWGLAAGALNNVPYVGPSVVVGAAAMIGLMQFGTFGMAGLLAGVAAAIALVEGLVVAPWLLSRAGRMNALAVFVGLTFWGWVWGIAGLFLAVPIMMVIKAICDHVEGGAAVSELLSD